MLPIDAAEVAFARPEHHRHHVHRHLVHEAGLEDLLRRNLAAGRLRFTTSYEEVAEFADVHFVCVGTPQSKNGYAADLTYVEAAFSTLAPLLSRRALVVGNPLMPATSSLGESFELPPLLFRSHLLRALHLRSDVPPFPAWMRADLRDLAKLRAREQCAMLGVIGLAGVQQHREDGGAIQA